MFKSIKHVIKQYLNFSKKDRNAIIILGILILVLIFANIIIDLVERKTDFDYSEFKNELRNWENNNQSNKEINQFLFYFDPNTISEQKLDSLLISDFIKQNLLRYRNAGGEIKTSTDFRKIYGMNDSIFSAIEKYIHIEKAENEIVENRKYVDTLKKYQFENKQPIDNPQNRIQPVQIIIELNNTDSAELVKLNGIGPVFAARIIKYRELLGGFYSKNQLLEVYNFPEETFLKIQNNILTDTLLIKNIRINFAEYKELLRHPYLNKEQVDLILKWREENGPFERVEEIYTQTGISFADFQRIKPYISCR